MGDLRVEVSATDPVSAGAWRLGWVPNRPLPIEAAAQPWSGRLSSANAWLTRYNTRRRNHCDYMAGSAHGRGPAGFPGFIRPIGSVP